MERIIITQDNFKNVVSEIYREEQIKIFEQKWKHLSENDKTFVLEFLKVLYPEKSSLIKESKWYNTVGDIAGIFDPTGLIDLANGISYWKQGDKLFAVLSWVSAIPGLGDVIAKPVVGALKAGGLIGKTFKSAVVAGDAIKVAEAAGKMGGPVATLVEKSPSWGSRLMSILKASVGKIPFLGRIVTHVEEFIKIFTTAGTRMKGGKSFMGKLLGRSETNTLKDTFRGFRDYGGFKNKYFKYISAKDVPLWNKFMAGVPHMFGGNPATRSLMRRSKWYLGLLDTLGLVDTKTTPEEVMAKYPKEVQKYNESEQGQKNWSDEFGGGSEIETTTDDTKKTSTLSSGNQASDNTNPFDVLSKTLFA
jgi:hypothetical protein